MELYQNRRSLRPLAAILLLAALFGFTLLAISACGSKNQPMQTTPTATTTLTPTATLPPTPTATPEPLGSENQPFVIGLVSETGDPQIAAAAQELARQVSALTNVSVIGSLYPSYQSLLYDMRAGKMHIAWLPPLTYLFASENDIAQVGLLTNHFGVYQYGTQYISNIESKFVPYFDPIAGESSATVELALAQLKGFRPCWVDPQSASGYILPAGLMQMNGLSSQPAVIAQSHTAVVRALYVKGICDFGATFSISGDPRTAANVQLDLPDVMNRIVVIWRTDAVIPNISLALSPLVPEADFANINNAFLEIVKTPQGKALLSLSAGTSSLSTYQIEDLKIVRDNLYDPLRQVVEALNLNLSEMIGK